MTDDELKELRTRHDVWDDRAALMAEVERLTERNDEAMFAVNAGSEALKVAMAEVERLKGIIGVGWLQVETERDSLKAEVERLNRTLDWNNEQAAQLKAEVERLRGVLQSISDGKGLYSMGIARAALEQSDD